MPTTKEIVLPSGRKLVMRDFLSFDDLEPTIKIEDSAEKTVKTMELALVSIDGITADVYKTLRTLPFPDYKMAIEEVTKLITGNFTPAK